MNTKKVVLNITPQTFVRVTQGDSIFFRIPRDQLRPAGLKRRKRIERYNQYKIDLSAEAKLKNFTIPAHGLCITFCIPAPKSWSKKQKKLHHGMLHQSQPDLDNLLKAFTDALVSEDKYIAHYGELSKRWVDFDIGWIEVWLIETTQMQSSSLILPPAKG